MSSTLSPELMETTWTNAIIYTACGLGLAFSIITTRQITSMKMDPSKVKVQILTAEEIEKIKSQNLVKENADDEGMMDNGPPQTPEACFVLMEKIAKTIQEGAITFLK